MIATGRQSKNRSKNRRRRAKMYGAAGRHFVSDLKRIYRQQRGDCAYYGSCGTELGDDYHVDHIIALGNGGSDFASNIQLCCPLCNQEKGVRDPIEFAQSRGLLL